MAEKRHRWKWLVVSHPSRQIPEDVHECQRCGLREYVSDGPRGGCEKRYDLKGQRKMNPERLTVMPRCTGGQGDA